MFDNRSPRSNLSHKLSLSQSERICCCVPAERRKREKKKKDKKKTVLLSAPTEAAWSKEQFKPAVKLGYLPLNNRRTITQ